MSQYQKKKSTWFLCIEWVKEEEADNKGRGKSEDLKIIQVKDDGVMDKSFSIFDGARWLVMVVELSGREEELVVRTDCKKGNKNDSQFFELSSCTGVYSCVKLE